MVRGLTTRQLETFRDIYADADLRSTNALPYLALNAILNESVLKRHSGIFYESLGIAYNHYRGLVNLAHRLTKNKGTVNYWIIRSGLVTRTVREVETSRPPTRKTPLMKRVEEEYGNLLEVLLPEMYVKIGLPAMVEKLGVSKATLWYWLSPLAHPTKKTVVSASHEI